MAMQNWVRLPTKWIAEHGLQHLKWRQEDGPNRAAALMVLMAIAHQADQDNGIAAITYDQLQAATGRSREKIARGLRVLAANEIIETETASRGIYKLSGYDKRRGWGKLPAKTLYSNGRLQVFDHFHLRKPVELDALKLYFLFVERRDNNSNLARVSFDKIIDYTQIPRNRIKLGTSLLVSSGLIHVERMPSKESEHGVMNAYRLAHLDPYRHMGTQGRAGVDEAKIDSAEVPALPKGVPRPRGDEPKQD